MDSSNRPPEDNNRRLSNMSTGYFELTNNILFNFEFFNIGLHLDTSSFCTDLSQSKININTTNSDDDNSVISVKQGKPSFHDQVKRAILSLHSNVPTNASHSLIEVGGQTPVHITANATHSNVPTNMQQNANHTAQVNTNIILATNHTTSDDDKPMLPAGVKSRLVGWFKGKRTLTSNSDKNSGNSSFVINLVDFSLSPSRYT